MKFWETFNYWFPPLTKEGADIKYILSVFFLRLKMMAGLVLFLTIMGLITMGLSTLIGAIMKNTWSNF